MKLPILLAAFLCLSQLVPAQLPDPPAKKTSYTAVTGYDDLSDYIHLLDERSDLLEAEVIGQSAQGRNLYALKFSSGDFGLDEEKIRVLIFAQQHGNEQSGKEGALLLARELLKEENRYLFDRIDLMLVPQVKNQRRNANGADLNRNHLTLTEPETRALHRVFNRYLFEVSLDVHEYSPYGEDWKNKGYRKNSEVTVGTTTNPNVSGEIRMLSLKGYLPFILQYLSDRGFSSFEYLPGGPPGISYIRRSTFDINDGRQSAGIRNTFAFIQEGMNGTDSFLENLQRRSEGQMAGMLGLLEYAYRNSGLIKNMVAGERQRIISGEGYQMITIQAEHMETGEKLELPVFSYLSGQDSVVLVDDFHPVVRSVCDVPRPEGYLVPGSLTSLVDWAERHELVTGELKKPGKYRFERYMVLGIDSIDFEGDKVVDPLLNREDSLEKMKKREYLFIPTAQIKGNLLVIALEPKSMLGLCTYSDYSFLLKEGSYYPIIRVISK
jgi:hypothetical protein